MQYNDTQSQTKGKISPKLQSNPVKRRDDCAKPTHLAKIIQGLTASMCLSRSPCQVAKEIIVPIHDQRHRRQSCVIYGCVKLKLSSCATNFGRYKDGNSDIHGPSVEVKIPLSVYSWMAKLLQISMDGHLPLLGYLQMAIYEISRDQPQLATYTLYLLSQDFCR